MYGQEDKSQLNCDIMMFKTYFLTIFQHHNRNNETWCVFWLVKHWTTYTDIRCQPWICSDCIDILCNQVLDIYSLDNCFFDAVAPIFSSNIFPQGENVACFKVCTNNCEWHVESVTCFLLSLLAAFLGAHLTYWTVPFHCSTLKLIQPVESAKDRNMSTVAET